MVRLAAASLCVEFQSDVNTNYSVELWSADRVSKPGLSDNHTTRFVILVSTNAASTEPRQIIPSPAEPRSVAASGCIFTSQQWFAKSITVVVMEDDLSPSSTPP